MNADTKKTKLTLTVKKDIIQKAKQKAKERGVSVSKLFEEAIEEDMEKKESVRRQKAFEKLRRLIKSSNPIQALPDSDRKLYHHHVDEKYG
ncbi:MAG: DUF6364 family protein [Bacteroidota bacterium]